MEKVKFGMIGCGGICHNHMGYLLPGIDNAEIVAVCDNEPQALAKTKEECGVPGFDNYKDLIDSGLANSVFICTPHYFHPEIMAYAFSKGLHVLCEKPVGVHVKQAKMMNETAAAHPELVFAVMFQARLNPVYAKAKELIESGEFGKILRATCIETSWYRSQTYYDSGGWRATWGGEGGGVLLNQCPHTLDVFTWLVGSPKRVIAMCKFGSRHRIEVEDEVSAIMEFENGALGQFVTSTGEAPGSSIFEIAFDRGLLRMSKDSLEFKRNRIPVLEHLATSKERFAKPEAWETIIPIKKKAGGPAHRPVTENFVKAVLQGKKLIASGTEGIHGLQLGNAILMSGITGKPVDLPLDGDAMEALIKDLCEKSTFVKNETVDVGKSDMNASFH